MDLPPTLIDWVYGAINTSSIYRQRPVVVQPVRRLT